MQRGGQDLQMRELLDTIRELRLTMEALRKELNAKEKQMETMQEQLNYFQKSCSGGRVKSIPLPSKVSSACSTRWRAKRRRRLRRNRMRRKNLPPLPGRAGPGRERRSCSGASP